MRTSILIDIKKTIILTMAAASCALPVWSQTAPIPGATPSASDQTQVKADHKTSAFLKEAWHDNDAEVTLAGVGERLAQNAELKSYAELLRKDHTQANKDLLPIAQKYGVTIDQSPSRKDQREVTKFEKLSGTEFDQKFAELMMTDHAKVINKYTKASQDIQQIDVKQYADTMLPKLREHFQKAVEIARTVGVDSDTISSISKKLPAVGGTGDTTESTRGTGVSTTEKNQPDDSSKELPKDESPKR